MKWNKIQPLLQMPLYKSPSNAVMMKWKDKLICEDGALKGCKTKKKKNNKTGKFYSLFSICPTSHTYSRKSWKKEQYEGCAAAWKCENCLLCSAGCCLILQDNGSALSSSFFALLCLFKHLELLLSSSFSLLRAQLMRFPTSARFVAFILLFHFPSCLRLSHQHLSVSVHNSSLPSCLLACLFVYLIHICMASPPSHVPSCLFNNTLML